MSELLDIVSLIILLLDTLGIGVLIWILVDRHRKPDVAAQERRTIIDRIEKLRKENREQTKNYIIFNHTRNAIIEDALGYVTRAGKVTITGEPLKIDSKYVAREVRLLVILKDGEDAGGFLGG